MDDRRTLYPEIQPYRTGFLPVGGGHTLYFEECGRPDGQPALFLHGGPGGGCQPSQRRFFDPSHYRIILFDQRGCGRSRPYASLDENTTWHLVSDIEALRRHLAIETWLVMGGSWGSTLALAYAQSHRQRVSHLVLRGICLLRRSEIQWFYQEGANAVFPEAFEDFLAPIPPGERDDLIGAYHQRLIGADDTERLVAARAWSRWEGACLSLRADPGRAARFGSDRFALAFARIECHYFVHGGFFRQDDQLLADAYLLSGIPGTLVQGRYDMVTPMLSAYQLAKAWPGAALHVVPDAGHAASEPGIVDALVRATDRYRQAVTPP